MKNLKLKALALSAADVLTRAELKNVVAGSGGACYQCCSPNDPNFCGRCDTSGTGGCMGNGRAWPCFCTH